MTKTKNLKVDEVIKKLSMIESTKRVYVQDGLILPITGSKTVDRILALVEGEKSSPQPTIMPVQAVLFFLKVSVNPDIENVAVAIGEVLLPISAIEDTGDKVILHLGEQE